MRRWQTSDPVNPVSIDLGVGKDREVDKLEFR
jgi:hypothetical protein